MTCIDYYNMIIKDKLEPFSVAHINYEDMARNSRLNIAHAT